MAHELAHALGLFHVQSRYDRDRYVLINMGNPSLLKSDFNKETTVTSTHYDIPYDYGSVMHYSSTAFAISNTQPSIVPMDKDYMDTMGSPFVSFYDVLLMNKHYGCLATTKAETLEMSLGSKGIAALAVHEKCHFWITPQGKGRRIQVKLNDVYSQWVGDGCTAGGVEIKPQVDQRLTGYRYCRFSSIGKAFVSTNEAVPVVIYRDRGLVQVAIVYQMI
ncbi:unnamed protein product [Cylicostephanus goldi]|uniref:Metalloendopeptidase n=1 Tax=Cylicostephanus goldi TaxID=71465 RepID=A0A3P7MK05_CYLGO|nr:unnamed protein product [Cylicostephanus goldi]